MVLISDHCWERVLSLQSFVNHYNRGREALIRVNDDGDEYDSRV